MTASLVASCPKFEGLSTVVQCNCMYVASSHSLHLYAPFSSLCLLIVVRETANDGGALVALKNDGLKELEGIDAVRAKPLKKTTAIER